MDHLYIISFFLTILTLSVECAYQAVSFKQPRLSLPTAQTRFTLHTTGSTASRPPRSFDHASIYGINNKFAQPQKLFIASSPINGVTVEIGRNGHLTPDFSNGLDYPDPYLVTGFAAEAIAKLLYSHELFYSDYPHLSAVLRYQNLRTENGLGGVRLGSIRVGSPFNRFRSQYYYS